jgi:hypothetical protein
MDDSESVIRELSEQTRWLRLLGIQALRPVLERLLVTDKQKLVYEASNGERSTREVGKIAGVSNSTVADLWREWAAVGIVAPVEGTSGRYRQLIPLSSLGYDVPAGPPTSKQSDDEDQSTPTMGKGEPDVR